MEVRHCAAFSLLMHVRLFISYTGNNIEGRFRRAVQPRYGLRLNQPDSEMCIEVRLVVQDLSTKPTQNGCAVDHTAGCVKRPTRRILKNFSWFEQSLVTRMCPSVVREE